MKRPITFLPRWAERFLRLICPDDLYEEIEGDLIQRHNRYLAGNSRSRANWKLIINVMSYLRPGIVMRHKMRPGAFNFIVLYNYMLTSYRHGLKFRLTAFFKLAGLTLAFFSLLVVSLYVSYQLSFDTFHKDHERIYRVNSERKENGIIEQYGIAPVAFGSLLGEGFLEVESYTRIDVSNDSYLKFGDKVVRGSLYAADSTLFDVFTFTLLRGRKDALARPGSVVLTRSISDKIFGHEDPLGKVITVNNETRLYEVAAIVEDMPSNSHIRAEAFVPFVREAAFNSDYITSPPGFVDQSCLLFVKLHPFASEQFLERLGKRLDRFVNEKDRARLGYDVFLQPLSDIYLDAPLKYEFTSKGSAVYLYTFHIRYFLTVHLLHQLYQSFAGEFHEQIEGDGCAQDHGRQ